MNSTATADALPLPTLSPADAAMLRQDRAIDALRRAVHLLETDPRLSRPEALFLSRSLRQLDRRSL